MTHRFGSIPLALLVAAWVGGCAQIERVFHEPQGSPAAVAPVDTSRARLAGYAPGPAPAERGVTPPADPPSTSDEKKVPDEQAKTDDSKPGDRPPVKPAYTAPGAAYQQLALAGVAAAALGVPEVLGAGWESSQALVLAPQGIVGRAGATTPSAMTAANVVVSRPGLQEGPATGLSFASPRNNIFRAQRNPLTGPNGRCADLVRAGFFPNGAACVAHFKK